MQRRTLLAALAAASCAGALPARAQQAPTRIVVGATPGGGTDTVARALAKEMSSILGQSFIVENRPGAGGNIAAQHVAQSERDGRTLLLCYTSHSINATLYKNLPFDPVKDFTPLSEVAYAPSILCANPKLAANDIPSLIALAKSQPGKLSIALPGIGSAGHLSAEVLKSRAGIDIVTVPYKGTAPAVTDVLAGQVDLVFSGLELAGGQLKEKKVKALGISSAKPMEELPGVHPIADTLPGFDYNAWYGLLGPAGLDPALVQRLSKAAQQALQVPDVRQRLKASGLITIGTSSKDFSTFLVQDIARWGEVVKASHAQI